MVTSRYDDCWREVRDGAHVGDDLTPEMLDDLWSGIVNGESNPTMAWFRDKPHQIAYRLLLRLTREGK